MLLFHRLGERTECQHVMRSLQSAVMLYGNDFHGQFPPNLRVVGITQQLPQEVLGCPKVGAKHADPQAALDSYCYLDWSTQPRSADWGSGKYPLIYDSHLANHGGAGINLVLVDGTVWWDADARWLREFARQHPDAHIAIPQ